jgi:hypothetical protein
MWHSSNGNGSKGLDCFAPVLAKTGDFVITRSSATWRSSNDHKGTSKCEVAATILQPRSANMKFQLASLLDIVF